MWKSLARFTNTGVPEEKIPEGIEFFPPEIWLLILQNVNEIEDCARLKRVSKLFCEELDKKDPLSSISDITWNKTVLNYFARQPKITVSQEAKIQCWKHVQRTTASETGTHYLCKTVIIGAAGIGKSALWRSFREESNQRLDFYPSNIGVDFCLRNLKSKDDISVRVQFWDTCGDERFRYLSQGYIRNAKVILLAFAIDDRQSFQDLIQRWFHLLVERKSALPPNAVFCLVGLKADLAAQRQVSRAEAQILANYCKMKYFEASSCEYNTVKQLFEEAIESMIVAESYNKIQENSDLATLIQPQPNARRCTVM